MIALPIGLYSATHKYSILDYILTLIAFIGIAIPGFILAVLIIAISIFYFDSAYIGRLYSNEFIGKEWNYDKIIDFLKHLSRVEILLHLIDIEEGDLKKIKQDYDDINVELKGFGNELSQKEQWVVISKVDKLSESEIKSLKKEAKKLFSRKNVFYVSSITGAGLKKIIENVGKKLSSEKN